MKSLVKAPRGVQCLTKILLAVLLDCEQKVPSARLSLRKDSLRLRSLIDKRGLPLYTTDLPALDAALLAGLETGEYKCLGLPLQRRRSRHGMIPRLFSGLYLLIFDEAGKLRIDADVDAIACLRQIFCLYKKYEQPCKEVKVNETLNNLYSVDSALKEPTLVYGMTKPMNRRFFLRVLVMLVLLTIVQACSSTWDTKGAVDIKLAKDQTATYLK